MSKAEYLRNRTIAFEQRGLNPNDKNYNCHHDYWRCDIKEGRLPKDFPIDAVENLRPLPVFRHEALNVYIHQNPELVNDISNRVNLGEMAEIGELDHLAPIEIRHVEKHKKYKKHQGNNHRR